jgi:hypothetical protein
VRPIDSLLGSLHALLAQPAGGGPAAVTRTTFDAAALADGSANNVFGCNCSTNRSGLSDAERQANVAANMKALGLA